MATNAPAYKALNAPKDTLTLQQYFNLVPTLRANVYLLIDDRWTQPEDRFGTDGSDISFGPED